MHDFFSKYILGDEIGHGAFAHVFKCINKVTGETKAVKISTDKSVLNEGNILEKLNHPAFPKVYDMYAQDNKFYVVMDYLSGTSLYNYLLKNTPLKENISLGILRRIVGALNYIHSLDVAHLDIKPENIMIDPATLQIQILDFGFARECASSCNSFNGSISYAAPELFFKKTFNACKADIWSVGVVFFTMLAGQLPFAPTEKKEEHIKEIVRGERQKSKYQIDEICQKIIDGCLTIDPSQRITGHEIIKIINDSSAPRCTRVFSLTVCSKKGPIIIRPNIHSASVRKNVRNCL